MGTVGAVVTGQELAAIALTAAFGGFLGALAQPILTHVLNLRQDRIDHERREKRSLRQMVEAKLGYGRSLFGALAVVELQGITVARLARDSVTSSRIFWRPERIKDELLAAAAADYDRVCSEMNLRLVAAEVSGALPTIGVLGAFLDRFMGLEKEIVVRMDDLGWPSVADADA